MTISYSESELITSHHKYHKYMKTFLVSLLVIFTQIMSFAQAPYKLPELGFAYNALEPYIDAMTMEIHLTKHHAAYVNNLNAALKGTNGENLTLIDLMKNISSYSPAVRNNAGGHLNHSLFWTILTPKKIPSLLLTSWKLSTISLPAWTA